MCNLTRGLCTQQPIKKRRCVQQRGREHTWQGYSSAPKNAQDPRICAAVRAAQSLVGGWRALGSDESSPPPAEKQKQPGPLLSTQHNTRWEGRSSPPPFADAATAGSEPKGTAPVDAATRLIRCVCAPPPPPCLWLSDATEQCTPGTRPPGGLGARVSVVQEVESRAHGALKLRRHALRLLGGLYLLRRHSRAALDFSPVVLPDFALAWRARVSAPRL